MKNHFSILALSNETPVEIVTGSCMSSMEIGHRKYGGKSTTAVGGGGGCGGGRGFWWTSSIEDGGIRKRGSWID